MSAKTYTITFNNKTTKTWHIGVYQKHPDFPGKSIVWKKKRVARHTEGVKLYFTLKYGVLVAGRDGGTEKEDAELGKAYQVKAVEDDWAFDPKAIQDIPNADMIYVYNKIDLPQHSFLRGTYGPPKVLEEEGADEGGADEGGMYPIKIGFTIDGDQIAPMKKDVVKGTKAIFQVHPTYFLALYDSVTIGQMIDSGVSGDPIEVRFHGEDTEMTVDVLLDQHDNTVLVSKNEING